MSDTLNSLAKRNARPPTHIEFVSPRRASHCGFTMATPDLRQSESKAYGRSRNNAYSGKAAQLIRADFSELLAEVSAHQFE
jgi:hypothetical protein